MDLHKLRKCIAKHLGMNHCVPEHIIAQLFTHHFTQHNQVLYAEGG